MSRPDTYSTSFKVVLGVMFAVCLSLPFWPVGGRVESAAEKKDPDRSNSRTTFRYASSDKPAREFDPYADESANREKIKRQLARRAHMEKSGMVKKIIEDEGMPEEIRSRFLAEKTRLDSLAEEYPEWASHADSVPLPRQVEDDGTLNPKFEEALKMMKRNGEWDRLHDTFVQQLEKAASDETLPDEERPTREEIDAVRQNNLIPVL